MKIKLITCIAVIIAIVLFWLYLVANLKEFELPFMIFGVIIATLISIYTVVMLGIIAVEMTEKRERRNEKWVKLDE